jgi:hypothetical protein
LTRNTAVTGLLVAGGCVLAAQVATALPERVWRWEVAAGFDASSHTYSLAVDDTTATIAEALLQAALEARSSRRARHRWRVRGDLSAGTELTRQRLDADYRLVDQPGSDRLRADATFTARQYRPDSEYNYNSDNNDGRLEVRGSPLLLGAAAAELRAHGSWHDYRTPSTLEVDDREWGGGVFLRSRSVLEKSWSGGVRAMRRVYPDSSEINRKEVGLDLTYDARSLEGNGLNLYHRSRRREIADETVRPSAWSHWTDLRLAVPAGSGRMVGELQGEIWDYDYETDVWIDSWRLEGLLGYRGGDMLKVSWLAGLTAARFDAGDAPDTYGQMGVRGGLESYTGSVGGTLTLEVGRRVYRDGTVTYTDSGLDESFELYSDFTYWKIWLMGQWYIADALSLEALASYEPENHTEQADDSALGFFNLRLVWRP